MTLNGRDQLTKTSQYRVTETSKSLIQHSPSVKPQLSGGWGLRSSNGKSEIARSHQILLVGVNCGLVVLELPRICVRVETDLTSFGPDPLHGNDCLH